MLELRNIIKDYLSGENTVHALKNINLNFDSNGMIAVLGESGCGKTTLLNVIGGLDKYTSGDILIDGVSTKTYKSNDWDAYRNKYIGFVFQSYNLIPHLTCLQNVALASTVGGESFVESKEKAKEILIKMGLEKEINKFPNQISGGQAQRVAVARALINNPKIILADEPTGALDSKNSISLMKTLKEISNDHLVILVTHNSRLADEFCDRIITMADGVVTSDSKETKASETPRIRVLNKDKSGFGFATSLRLSWSTIFTKKGRSIITAIASSIGIIGVGLILALSNGFQAYITKVQTETSSNMPIIVSSAQTSFKPNPNYKEYTKFPNNEEIIVYDASTSGQYIYLETTNNLTNDYVNYVNNIDNTKYKGSIGSKIINYTNINHNIFAQNTKINEGDAIETIKINPYSSVSGGTIASVIASISGLPKSILHEFYGDQNYIGKSYDVLAGAYPQDSIVNGDTFEVALVLDSYNRIESNTLKKLGFYSSSQIDYMVQNNKTINFNDFIGKTYTFYLNDDLYDEQGRITNKANDRTTTTQTITIKDQNGNDVNFDVDIPISDITQYAPQNEEDYYSLYNGTYQKYSADGTTSLGAAKAYHLKVSAIMRVNKNALIDYMPASLCYNQSFKDFVYKYDNASKIVNDTTHKLYANIDIYNLQSLFNLYNTKNVFPMFKTMGFIDDNVEVPAWAAALSEATQNDFTEAFQWCGHWYAPLAKKDSNSHALSFNDSYYTYSGYISSLSKLGLVFDNIDYTNVKDFINIFNSALTAARENNTVRLAYYTAQLNLKIQEDSTILPMMFVYLATKLSNYSQITSLIIFPTSLTTKPALKEYLDNYNVNKENTDVVSYADYAGDLTDQLYSIVSIISIVLVIFSSISLIVSSIMSGVITYTSVIERTKEIGVYRAIGARKKDVGRLFIFENIIIGIFSGVLGILLVYLISIPINVVISGMFAKYNIGNICSLSALAAIVLVAIAGFLAFISSIIPAYVASKKDPVVALRSE